MPHKKQKALSRAHRLAHQVAAALDSALGEGDHDVAVRRRRLIRQEWRRQGCHHRWSDLASDCSKLRGIQKLRLTKPLNRWIVRRDCLGK